MGFGLQRGATISQGAEFQDGCGERPEVAREAQTTSCWYVHVERNFMIDTEVCDWVLFCDVWVDQEGFEVFAGDGWMVGELADGTLKRIQRFGIFLSQG